MNNESLTQSQREAKATGIIGTMRLFVSSNGGWCFNLVFAHLLFWMYGFTALLDYGYSDFNQDDNGKINSGPSGSGVGIITTILAASATIIVLMKLVTFNPTVDV